jgi:hypothetical protein
MKGLFFLTATVAAGHILQGTIKAELNPAASEITSKSLRWIGIFLPSQQNNLKDHKKLLEFTNIISPLPQSHNNYFSIPSMPK